MPPACACARPRPASHLQASATCAPCSRARSLLTACTPRVPRALMHLVRPDGPSISECSGGAAAGRMHAPPPGDAAEANGGAQRRSHAWGPVVPDTQECWYIEAYLGTSHTLQTNSNSGCPYTYGSYGRPWHGPKRGAGGGGAGASRPVQRARGACATDCGVCALTCAPPRALRTGACTPGKAAQQAHSQCTTTARSTKHTAARCTDCHDVVRCEHCVACASHSA